MLKKLPIAPEELRWLCVLPAFVIGFVVPGILVGIGSSFNHFGWLEQKWTDLIQSGIGGYCAVYFAAAVAPRFKRITAVAAALLLLVVSGVFGILAWQYRESTSPALWVLVNLVVTLGAGGAAVGVAIDKEKEDRAEEAWEEAAKLRADKATGPIEPQSRDELLTAVAETEAAQRAAGPHLCSICGDDLTRSFGEDLVRNYPNLVCRQCNQRAVREDGKGPRHDSGADWGDNPVFVDGIKCWRRYKFGGFVTMRDMHDCATIKEFYERHVMGRG
jgi:hypothetical protein